MPKAGTPDSNSVASACGAPGAYTLDGPPESTIAAGLRASTSSAGTVEGTISEETPASRVRGAIRWADCAPKATARTVGKSITMTRNSAPDDQVDPLELLEVAVAGLGHRPAQRPEQVGPPVGLLGRAEQHLLQRAGRRQRRGGATA